MSANLYVKSINGGNRVNVFTDTNTVYLGANLSDLTLESNGTGQNLVVIGSGPNFVARSLVATGDATVSQSGNVITISSNTSSATLTSGAGGLNLVSLGAGKTLSLQSLQGRGTASVSLASNVVTITDRWTLSSVGTAQNIVSQGQGPSIALKSIVNIGPTITLSSNATDVTIGNNLALGNVLPGTNTYNLVLGWNANIGYTTLGGRDIPFKGLTTVSLNGTQAFATNTATKITFNTIEQSGVDVVYTQANSNFRVTNTALYGIAAGVGFGSNVGAYVNVLVNGAVFSSFVSIEDGVFSNTGVRDCPISDFILLDVGSIVNFTVTQNTGASVSTNNDAGLTTYASFLTWPTSQLT